MWVATGKAPLALGPLALLVLAGVAEAADSEPLRIRISSGLFDEVVRGHLPALVRLPPPSGEPSAPGRPTLASLTDLSYCGTNEKGGGRFRAVFRLDSLNGPAALLPSRSGCDTSLVGLARRLGEGSEGAGVVVADVEATWRAWELRLAVVRTEATGKSASARLAAVLEKRREFLVVPTADARLQTAEGPLALYAIPAFLPAAVEIAMVLGESGAPASPERLALATRGQGVVGDGNSAAWMPLGFANRLLRRLSGTRPLTIALGGENVELRNASLGAEGAGAGTRLTLQGSASPASLRATVRWTVVAAGDPLRLEQVQMVAQAEDCSGLGAVAAVACNLRNGTQAAAAGVLASSLNERYGGTPVHQLIGPQSFRFTVAGERVTLVGDLLRLSCASRALSANGRLAAPAP